VYQLTNLYMYSASFDFVVGDGPDVVTGAH
jgi:hypothetical protein